jgi:predicted Zn-dependent protease
MGHRVTKLLSACRPLFIATAAVVFLLAAATPQKAEAAFCEFTIKDEAELGRKIKASIRTSFPVVEDPEVVDYINGVFQRLMKSVPPQPFDYSITVVRHNAINAFTAPGGNLFLFTELILAMDHEAEMAGVLAHEIGHATQRHIAGRIQQMQKVSMLTIAGAVLGAFLGGDAGSALMVGSMAAGQAAQLSYSRADEMDADHVGMSYLIKAGYPPRGMVGAFEKIRKQQWLIESSIPTYLSTHPDIQDRINYLSTRITTLAGPIRNRKDDDAKFKRIQTLIRARYSDPDRAMAIFNAQTEDKGPMGCLAYMGQGIVHSRYNRVSEATAAFDKALACTSNDSLIEREAGMFHYLRGEKNRTPELLKRALQENPKDHIALFFYARHLVDTGNIAQAQEYYERILKDIPDDPEVHFFYAQGLGRDRQMFKAYLHMAYSSLYSNDKKKTKQNIERAKAEAKTPQDQNDLKKLEAAFKERLEIFEGT